MFKLTKSESNRLRLARINNIARRRDFKRRIEAHAQDILAEHEGKKQKLIEQRNGLRKLLESVRGKRLDQLFSAKSNLTGADKHVPKHLKATFRRLLKADKEIAAFEKKRHELIQESVSRVIEGFHTFVPGHNYVNLLSNLNALKKGKPGEKEILRLSEEIGHEAKRIKFNLAKLPNPSPVRPSKKWFELHSKLLPLFYAMLNKGHSVSRLTGRD